MRSAPFRRAANLAAIVSTSWGFAALAVAQEGAPRLAPGEPIPPAELEAFVDGVVAAAMAEHRIIGVTVSAVQGGQVVLAKGYGFADLATGRRVDPQLTLFRIASITKTFTWIAIMRLVEAGALSLDDPVNNHLPAELAIPDQGMAEPIRVRDLMTHQPGFEDRALGVLFIDDAARIRPLGEFLRDTRPNRVRAPGELSSYSNYGTALAGAIVEHVTGRRWQDLIETDILVPLGMTHTTGREPYPARDDLPAPLAEPLAMKASQGYRWVGASPMAQPYEHITQMAPAGAMSSTAADMARYMLMLLGEGALDGARIFGAEAARTFRTPMTSLPREIGGWDGGFMEVAGPGGFRGYGHGGTTPTFFSGMTVSPELDLGLFVSTNTAGGSALSDTLWARVVQRFYAAPPPAPLAGRPELRTDLAASAGQYLLTRRRYEGLEGFVMRLRAVPIGFSADGYVTATLGPRALRFVPTDEPNRFQNADDPSAVAFVERRDGRFTVSTPFFALEQLGPLESPTTLMLAGALTVIAAVASLIGLCMRVGRNLPVTPLQARAGQLQIVASALWLVSLGSLGLFAAITSSNVNALFYDWPTPSILVFSIAALAASVATLGLIALLPTASKGTGGWSPWRKVRFTATTLAFVFCAAVLLSWGALQPWNP